MWTYPKERLVNVYSDDVAGAEAIGVIEALIDGVYLRLYRRFFIRRNWFSRIKLARIGRSRRILFFDRARASAVRM